MDAVIGELLGLVLMGSFSRGLAITSPSVVAPIVREPSYSVLPVPEPTPTYVHPITQAPSNVPLFLSLTTGKPVVQTIEQKLAAEYVPAIQAQPEAALLGAQQSYAYYSAQESLTAAQQADFAYVKAILARLGY